MYVDNLIGIAVGSAEAGIRARQLLIYFADMLYRNHSATEPRWLIAQLCRCRGLRLLCQVPGGGGQFRAVRGHAARARFAGRPGAGRAGSTDAGGRAAYAGVQRHRRTDVSRTCRVVHALVRRPGAARQP